MENIGIVMPSPVLLPWPNSSSSSSSSPSHHDFSFSVSIQSEPYPSSTAGLTNSDHTIDLSPADDIFFHGHLLPLHLIPQHSSAASPRSSTNSLDMSFTLPIRSGLSQDHHHQNQKFNEKSFIGKAKANDEDCDQRKEKSKPKSFPMPAGLSKWRKRCEGGRDNENNKSHKRRLGLELSYLVKKYTKILIPFLSLKGKNRRRYVDCQESQNQSYNSFSGNLNFRNNKDFFRGGRREFSAPVSVTTSPANSGVLATDQTIREISSNTSESTMQELQAAIQAAIDHCKNSTAADNTEMPYSGLKTMKDG